MKSGEDIKAANKRFFDVAADVYEEVDARRGEKVSLWLDDSLSSLKKHTGGGALLDVGCGTGFVMRKAQGKFGLIVGVDISREMLKQVKVGYPICADVDYLPFKDGVFDAAVAIAVLHHVLEHKPMFTQVNRVLKAQGVFYTDHDLDDGFVGRFGWLVRLRRRFCDNSIGYLKAKRELTKELYEDSEVHHDGINSRKLKKQLQDSGFSEVNVRYHWLGLYAALNTILSITHLKRMPYGLAPNASFWARK